MKWGSIYPESYNSYFVLFIHSKFFGTPLSSAMGFFKPFRPLSLINTEYITYVTKPSQFLLVYSVSNCLMCIWIFVISSIAAKSVSYTHLDVYKRQVHTKSSHDGIVNSFLRNTKDYTPCSCFVALLSWFIPLLFLFYTLADCSIWM